MGRINIRNDFFLMEIKNFFLEEYIISSIFSYFQNIFKLKFSFASINFYMRRRKFCCLRVKRFEEFEYILL